jgi:hypothetical protein
MQNLASNEALSDSHQDIKAGRKRLKPTVKQLLRRDAAVGR